MRTSFRIQIDPWKTQSNAKMLGIGAWEGTHDVDIQTRKIKSDLERISKQVDAVEEYTGTLQLLRERAKNSIGGANTTKSMDTEISMYKYELYAAQMQH